ncbi:TadE/TadG family type IV pilus assembly protein [Aminobacter sp. P9b]|uniref:TadE/TadG family type IV pilus assembly protein n=1 Tax=Aminobacter sp. P9b TaxID=3133697 RepID=UPI00324988EE
MEYHYYFAYKQYSREIQASQRRMKPSPSRQRRKLGAEGSKPFTELIGLKSRQDKILARTRPPDRQTIIQDQSGTSAIEFAIVAPVFILLVFGMIAYGIYFGALHSVQQMAADAARTAIAGLDENERKTLAQRYIDLNADGYVFIDRKKLVVEVKDSDKDSEQFVVSLRYDAGHLPIWNLLPMLPLPEKTISRSSTIRVGGI